jgi:hypothetical protein
MAARDDWFRSSAWDAAAQQLFEQKLARTRSPSSRFRYLNVKADAIVKAHPHAALEMLFRCLNEPEREWEDTSWRRSMQIYTHTEIGEYLQERDRPHEAEHHFRAAIGICPLGQRKDRGPFEPEERLTALLVRSADMDRRAEGEKVWEVYRRWVGSPGGYPGYAFPTYGEMERRTPRAPKGTPPWDPESAAEDVIAEYADQPGRQVLSRNDRRALEALDRHFRSGSWWFLPRRCHDSDHLAGQFIPALAAYLARVLVKEVAVSWVVRNPVLKSRLRIGRREINPFRAAYKAVYFEYLLTDLLDEMIQAAKKK